MVVYRFGRWRYTIPSRVIRVPFSILYKLMKIHVESVTGTELPCEAVGGAGALRIEHSFDIVVSGDAVIGDDVVIRDGVTIGLRHEGKRGSPVIGNRVDIGAGAKILGPIHIGDDVSIGRECGGHPRCAGWMHRGWRTCPDPGTETCGRHRGRASDSRALALTGAA